MDEQLKAGNIGTVGSYNLAVKSDAVVATVSVAAGPGKFQADLDLLK